MSHTHTAEHSEEHGARDLELEPTHTRPRHKRFFSHWVTKLFLIAGGIVLALIIILLSITAVYAKKYEHAVYPGVHIGDIDLSGKTYTEALDIIESRANTLEEGITLTYTGKEIIVPGIIPPTDAAGEEVVLFDIDPEKTAEAVFAHGRTGNIFERIQALVPMLGYKKTISAIYQPSQKNVTAYLTPKLKPFETEPKNAIIQVTEGSKITIIPDVSGEKISLNHITNGKENPLFEAVAALSTEPIALELMTVRAAITAEDITAHENEIHSLLAAAPLTFVYQDKKWSFDATEIGAWLTYTEKGVGIDPEKLHTTLTAKTKDGGVEVEPVEGKWQLEKNEDGTPKSMKALQEPVVGKKFDDKKAADAALKALKNKTASAVELSMTEYQPKFMPQKDEDGNITLPVKDLLGTGHSNMSGSPVNRQGNIHRGAELLNGVIIAPGEEFSLLNHLKPFTLENGYKAELVIKGNQTLPEIGGGLCQVGTTTFRGVMNSGLDVTMRQNHSYAVSYYSDDRNHLPGTDATIYDPAPDFKFLNDTDHYILIQTNISGQDLNFDFWGTSDGRKGEFSPPTIGPWIQPPAAKITETDQLAPGVKKCTEIAHPGTTASTIYTVTKSDGTKTSREFISKYKPWQAVCLVGKSAAAPAPTPAATPAKETSKNTNTSKNSNSNTNTKKQ